jgi:hypothetical protein
MILRNSTTGAFEIYDIKNNAITAASSPGTVGLNFQVAGFGAFHAAGASDMVLRNANTGEFEVYDIVNNQITTANSLGTVGLDWSVGGFAADPPSASGAFSDGSNDRLVQVMAGFADGSGAAENVNTGVFAAGMSQAFLAAVQHG